MPKKKDNQRIPFVVTYNPTSPNLKKIIAKNFPIVQSSNRCKQVFSKKPFIAYRRPRSLRDFLVKAKIKHTQTTKRPPTITTCTSTKCKTCSFIQDGLSSFTFKNTDQNHRIKQTMTSKNLIYMIQCRKCKNIPGAPAEYIGQTKRALRDRFGKHRRGIQNKTTDAVPQHFNQKGHKLTDVELVPLELINSKRESIRRARETINIELAKTAWFKQRRRPLIFPTICKSLSCFYTMPSSFFSLSLALSPFDVLNFKFLTCIIYQIITVSQFVYYTKSCNDFPFFH